MTGAWSAGAAWIDGQYCPIAEAKISMLDRRPGRLTRRLQDLYWARHSDPRYSTPVRYDDPA